MFAEWRGVSASLCVRFFGASVYVARRARKQWTLLHSASDIPTPGSQDVGIHGHVCRPPSVDRHLKDGDAAGGESRSDLASGAE